MKITHITIDLWNTVLKSNKDYRERFPIEILQHLISDNAFLGGEPTVSLVAEKYNDTKRLVNDIELRSGRSLSIEQKHLLFADNLRISGKHVDSTYFRTIHDLFLSYPPEQYYKGIFNDLAKLADSYDVTIISNSGMTQSEWLIDYMSTIPNIDYHFSDQNMFAKPNPKFYQEWIGDISLKNFNEWLHIGDSVQMDIEPVKKLQGRAYLIKEVSDWDNLKRILL